MRERERERGKERGSEEMREMWATESWRERINKLIKYYTILLQCALKNESAL